MMRACGRWLGLSVVSGFLGACTYTVAVTQTNVPRKREHVVEASVKKYIVLGFNFDNDEVLQLTEKLRNKCPNGRVSGILTKDLRTMYFLFFFWARETIATGYCNTATMATNSAGGADLESVIAAGDESDREVPSVSSGREESL